MDSSSLLSKISEHLTYCHQNAHCVMVPDAGWFSCAVFEINRNLEHVLREAPGRPEVPEEVEYPKFLSDRNLVEGADATRVLLDIGLKHVEGIKAQNVDEHGFELLEAIAVAVSQIYEGVGKYARGEVTTETVESGDSLLPDLKHAPA